MDERAEEMIAGVRRTCEALSRGDFDAAVEARRAAGLQ
jgi:hypothetical protein